MTSINWSCLLCYRNINTSIIFPCNSGEKNTEREKNAHGPGMETMKSDFLFILMKRERKEQLLQFVSCV